MNYEDNNKAIYYLNESNRLFRCLAPADLRRVDNYANLARIYLRMDDLPSARNSLDSGVRILAQQEQSVYASYYYTTECMYYIKLKDWGEAEKSIDKGLAVAEKLKSRQDIHVLLYQKARLYDFKHDPVTVKKILLKLLNEGYARIDLDKKQIYHDLAYTDSLLGNMSSAYSWMVRYSDLADNVYQKETRLKITDLETRYNYTQKEKELLMAKAKVKKQRLIVWGSLFGTVVAVAFFLILYRTRRTKAKQEMQIALAQALLDGEEKERVRVARDLHDGLSGMLAGVKINLTHALQGNTSAEINQVIGQLDNSIMELRRIARNMMPQTLLNSGLEAALKELCTLTANDRLKVYSKFMNLRRDLSTQVQLIIYRIVQELLANVVKHAAATEAFVQCSEDENMFYLTVEDNGSGYTQKDGHIRTGLGLENIKSRIDFLKGKMEVAGGSGKGTIVNIELNTDEKK